MEIRVLVNDPAGTLVLSITCGWGNMSGCVWQQSDTISLLKTIPNLTVFNSVMVWKKKKDNSTEHCAIN